MSDERWVPLAGYEDSYRISSLGNVQRTVPPSRKSALVFRNLKSYTIKSGYNHIFVNKPMRERTQFRLCRLMLFSFVGAPPTEQHQANHINGRKNDDRIENLEWVTPQQNCRHAYDSIGRTKPHGSKHHSAKLTEDIVREAKQLALSGVRHGAIAARFGVTRACVSMAIRGTNWSHIST